MNSIFWGDRVQDVATVLLGERGQVDAYARDVDALAATELTVVLTDREELVAFLLLYVEGKSTASRRMRAPTGTSWTKFT